MKHLILIVIAVIFCVGGISAQDGKAKKLPKPVEESDSIKSLNKYIADLKKKHKADITFFADSIKVVLKEKDDLIKNLNKELQATYTPKKYIDENTNLKAANACLSSDIAIMKYQIDSLKTVIQEFEIKNNDAASKVSENSNIILKLQQQNDSLMFFKRYYLAELADVADRRWLLLPFSQINISELEHDCQKCQQYANDDVNVRRAGEKLNILLQNCYTYNQAIELIYRPFDAVAVSGSQKKLSQMLKTVTDIQKTEVESVNTQLQYYSVRVWAFQSVIKAVDGRIADGKKRGLKHFGILAFINNELNKQQSDYQYITMIEANPWLKVKYAEYKKQIEQNCLAPNTVRDEIMNLKAD